MAKSYWLINLNRSEVKRFMKNDKSVDGGPQPPLWIVLIVNPLLCIYGLLNNKN